MSQKNFTADGGKGNGKGAKTAAPATASQSQTAPSVQKQQVRRTK